MSNLGSMISTPRDTVCIKIAQSIHNEVDEAKSRSAVMLFQSTSAAFGKWTTCSLNVYQLHPCHNK